MGKHAHDLARVRIGYSFQDRGPLTPPGGRGSGDPLLGSNLGSRKFWMLSHQKKMAILPSPTGAGGGGPADTSTPPSPRGVQSSKKKNPGSDRRNFSQQWMSSVFFYAQPSSNKFTSVPCFSVSGRFLTSICVNLWWEFLDVDRNPTHPSVILRRGIGQGGKAGFEDRGKKTGKEGRK